MKTVVEGKYLDLISQGEKENQTEEREFANERALLHVRGAVLKTRELLADAKKKVKICAKAEPYVLQAEIDAILEVDALEVAIDLSEKIRVERFGEETAKK